MIQTVMKVSAIVFPQDTGGYTWDVLAMAQENNAFYMGLAQYCSEGQLKIRRAEDEARIKQGGNHVALTSEFGNRAQYPLVTGSLVVAIQTRALGTLSGKEDLQLWLQHQDGFGAELKFISPKIGKITRDHSTKIGLWIDGKTLEEKGKKAMNQLFQDMSREPNGCQVEWDNVQPSQTKDRDFATLPRIANTGIPLLMKPSPNTNSIDIKELSSAAFFKAIGVPVL
jgi:hypothetical protein